MTDTALWSGRNACGKVAYLTRRDAARARRRFSARSIRPYKCASCGLWHLGHLPQAAVYGLAAANDVYRAGGAR